MAEWKVEDGCDHEIVAGPEICAPAVSIAAAGVRHLLRDVPFRETAHSGIAESVSSRVPANEPLPAFPSASEWTPRQVQIAKPLAAGSIVRVNLAMDLLLVSGAIILDGLAAFPQGSAVALALFTMVAGAVWAIAGVTLGYYDASAYDRDTLGDAVLVATMVLATMFVAIVFNVVCPHSR